MSAPVISLEPDQFAGDMLDFLNPGDVEWTRLAADLSKADRTTVNILLVGQDRREGEGRTRADSILLCSFNKDSHKLTMTSFLRDLYVPIPGHGSDRINSAYALGGVPLLTQTLEENFGIAIHGAVEADFAQFATVIDSLGGVRIALRQDEADLINQETGRSLTEGSQLLTGQEALAYSRIRSLDLDGDFSRTDRQRKVMSAVVGAYKGAGLSTILSTLKDILPMVSTDMNEARLLMLAVELFPLLRDLQITGEHIPAAGTYSDTIVNGMAVLSADMDAARSLLREITGGS